MTALLPIDLVEDVDSWSNRSSILWHHGGVAGGMTGGGRRGLGIPLADRVRAGAASSAPVPSPAGDAGSPARHCWVADAVDGEGVDRPGLLVEWRQGEAGWEGRVLYSTRLRGAETASAVWAVVEEWLPADRLTPW